MAGIALLGAASVAIAIPASAAASTAHRLGLRTMKAGSRGADVIALQRDLTESGFAVRVTGVYSSATAHRVAQFERRYGLAVNSVATPSFVRALLKIRNLDAAAIGADSNGGGGLGATGSGATGGSSTGTTTTGTGTTTTGTTTGTTATGTATTTGTAAMPKLKGHKYAYGSRNMRAGMTGTDVEYLQDYLTLAGFPTSIDGQFGPSTRASVLSFQQANDYRTNGVVMRAQAMELRRDVNTASVATGTSEQQATLNSNGTVTAPADAPAAVQNAIAAANTIIDDPYIYGGGHASFTDVGYDCSGAVSFALHGGGLIASPEDSSQLETYGDAGPGQWITVYTDPSHAFVVIAGLAFDTAHYGATFPAGTGPRWLEPSDVTANLSDGGHYVERHPAGL